LLVQAGNPQACSVDQTAENAAFGTRVSLERIQLCLKALKAAKQ